ncbi:MAG: hypothetical protein AAF907_06985, partial [Planctomycetota bacterium]
MKRPLAIPLAPYGPGGMFDAGLSACGASPALWLRLTLAAGLPAAILAETAGRAFDLGWPTALFAALFLTAPLGPRIVGTAVRGAFPDEADAEPAPGVRSRRLRAWETLLGVLCVPLAAAYWLPRWLRLPTEIGDWLAQPIGLVTVGMTFAAVLWLWLRAGLVRRTPFPRPIAGLVTKRLFFRALLAGPLWLWFVEDWETVGLVLFLLWAPFGLLIGGRIAYGTERIALQALAVRLHDEHADALIRSENVALFGRALGLACLSFGLWLLGILAVDLLFSSLVGLRPVLGVALEASDFWAGVWRDASAAALGALGGTAVYVVARMAWFATLVDLRVRYDCWDVQQAVTRERNCLAAEERRTAPKQSPAAPVAVGPAESPDSADKRSRRVQSAATAAAVAALLALGGPPTVGAAPRQTDGPTDPGRVSR